MEERKSRLRQILDAAPKGMREALDALNQETGSKYPTEVSDDLTESTGERTIEAEFSEIGSGKQANAEDALREEYFGSNQNNERGIQISQGDNQIQIPSSSTELDSNSLAAAQQAKLNAMDQALLNKISTGPSSIIDQDVMAQLQRIRPQAPILLREYFLSPRQAFKALSAQAKETTAKAQVREAVADAALSIAEIAKQDLERKVFETFIEQLEKTEGKDIEIYCEQHNIQEVPQQGDMQRKVILLRMHAANLALSQYKVALQKEQKEYVQKRAQMEGRIAMSNMNADMLPSLIEANARELPLQRTSVYQRAGHRAALVSGTIAAIGSGLVGGAIAGIYYGAESGINAVKDKVMEGVDGIKNINWSGFGRSKRK